MVQHIGPTLEKLYEDAFKDGLLASTKQNATVAPPQNASVPVLHW